VHLLVYKRQCHLILTFIWIKGNFSDNLGLPHVSQNWGSPCQFQTSFPFENSIKWRRRAPPPCILEVRLNFDCLRPLLLTVLNDRLNLYILYIENQGHFGQNKNSYRNSFYHGGLKLLLFTYKGSLNTIQNNSWFSSRPLPVNPRTFQMTLDPNFADETRSFNNS